MSSNYAAVRVFRALLAPAKSSSSAAAPASKSTAPASSKSAVKPKSQPGVKATKKAAVAAAKPAREPTGIQKPIPLSPQLRSFMGVDEASRVDAVKQIWAYVKLNNLQNPADKKEIYCDDKLKGIFDGKDKVGFLEIGRLLTRHFVKSP